MGTRIGPDGVCEYESNTYDVDGTSASIIDCVKDRRDTLFFRGIVAGEGITVNLIDVSYPDGLGYSYGKTIQINSTGGGSSSGDVKVEDAATTGTSLIGSSGVVNNTIPFRTIAVSNGLQISETNDVITISAEDSIGAKWYVISNATPDNSVGNDGDMLINSNGEIYNKVSGTWTDSTVNIRGPEGLGITNRGDFATGVQYNVNDIIINPVNGNYGGSVFIVTKAFDSTNITLSDAESAGDVQLLVENGQRGSMWYYGAGTDNASIIQNATSSGNTALLAANEGDFFLSSDNSTVYEATSSGWTSTGVVLKGAVGPKGDTGTGLTNKGDWVSGTTYTAGDYVFAKTSDTDSSTSMFIYQGDGTSASTKEPADDTTNWVEFTAPQGQRGSKWTVSTSTTAPTSVSDAQLNDMYMTSGGVIYVLSSVATDGTQTWTQTTTIVGPKGDAGISPTVTVGTTTTGVAGTDASVTVDSTSTTSNTILDFTIPQGKDGTKWFYNKTATDGSSLKSEGGNVGDYCIISTGEIYTLTSIDSSENETWTDTGINITGPTGDKGTSGSKWYLGTISSPTISTISSDPVLSGVTLNSGDDYLGQDNYVYVYSGTAWTKSTTYLGGSSSGTEVSFDTTGTALGSLSNNAATIYSLTSGTGISLSEGSDTITISTTGASISATVGSTTTTDITTLVQGSNVTFDTSTKGSLTISSTSSGGASALSGLSDASISSATTGQVLTYDASANKWENKNPSVTVDEITGTLYVSKGGTGQTSFTTNGVVIGNGTNALGVTPAPTTSGQVLTWNGTSFEFDTPTTGVSIESAGTTQGSANTINFTGSGVSVSTASGVSTVTVSGGSSSGTGVKNVTFRLVFDNNSSNNATGYAVKADGITDTSIIASPSSFSYNTDGAGGVKFTTLLDNTYVMTNIAYLYSSNLGTSWEQSPSAIIPTATYTDNIMSVVLGSFQSSAIGGSVGTSNNNTICYVNVEFSNLGSAINTNTSIT